MESTQTRANAPVRPSDEDRLKRALRLAASQASAMTGGGAALVYTRASDDPTTGRLRAAAGFLSTDEVRQVAGGLHSIVGDVLANGEAQTGDRLVDLGERGAAGTLALPMAARNETHGVLVVASATALIQVIGSVRLATNSGTCDRPFSPKKT